MTNPNLTSDYAILDVRRGRKKLARAIQSGKEMAVTIHGVVRALNSQDDGVSIEFCVDVHNVEFGEVIERIENLNGAA